MKAHGDLRRVQIIVLEAVGKGDFSRTFLKRLMARVRTGNYPDCIRNIIPLDITRVITQDHYYTLDDHWTPAGHSMIGAALAEVIREKERK